MDILLPVILEQSITISTRNSKILTRAQRYQLPRWINLRKSAKCSLSLVFQVKELKSPFEFYAHRTILEPLLCSFSLASLLFLFIWEEIIWNFCTTKICGAWCHCFLSLPCVVDKCGIIFVDLLWFIKLKVDRLLISTDRLRYLIHNISNNILN